MPSAEKNGTSISVIQIPEFLRCNLILRITQLLPEGIVGGDAWRGLPVASTSLVHVAQTTIDPPFALTSAQAILKKVVLDSVLSIHLKHDYAKALDDLFVFCAGWPLSRVLLTRFLSFYIEIWRTFSFEKQMCEVDLVGKGRRVRRVPIGLSA